METIKKILEYIWIGISYLFKGLWTVLRFLFILIWRGVVWIWDFIVLRLTTRRTASGNFDRRFKSTQEIENKEMGCVGAVIVIVLILWLIGSLLPDKNEVDSNKDMTDTVAVEKSMKPQKREASTVASKENENINKQDTTIDLHLIIEEELNEKLEIELEESPCEIEPRIEKLNNPPVDEEELPELPTIDLPTSNEAL